MSIAVFSACSTRSPNACGCHGSGQMRSRRRGRTEEVVMLQKRDFGARKTEPIETPTAEVDWAAWWEAIDKRVEEHLVNERETMIDAVGKALAMERQDLRENADEFRGPPGRPGKDAKLPRVKLWQEDCVYYEGDCVAFNGSVFQAQCDTGKSPLFAKHWMCLATAGVDGKPIRHRGTFDPEVEYREHDAVLVDGSSFVALRDDP